MRFPCFILIHACMHAHVQHTVLKTHSQLGFKSSTQDAEAPSMQSLSDFSFRSPHRPSSPLMVTHRLTYLCLSGSRFQGVVHHTYHPYLYFYIIYVYVHVCGCEHVSASSYRSKPHVAGQTFLYTTVLYFHSFPHPVPGSKRLEDDFQMFWFWLSLFCFETRCYVARDSLKLIM